MSKNHRGVPASLHSALARHGIISTSLNKIGSKYYWTARASEEDSSADDQASLIFTGECAKKKTALEKLQYILTLLEQAKDKRGKH